MNLLPPFRPRRAALLAAGLGWALVPAAYGQNLGLTPDEDPDERDGLPAMKMLVKGSILQDIMIPQYDEKLRLSSVLRAEKIVLVDDDTIDAETVEIDFFNADQSPSAGIRLPAAVLHEQRILRASGPVTLSSDDLDATGTGLVYEVRGSRGFLQGPATARTRTELRTSMIPAPAPLRLGAAGIAMIAASALHAEPPTPLTEQERTGLDRLAVSKADEAASAAAETAEEIEEAEDQSEAADESLRAFLREAAIEIADGPMPDLTEKLADPEELPEDALPATIQADDGIFFDTETGILVFLKNVRVRHPEFNLDGADEVKVFMEKPDEAPEAEPKEDAKDEIFGGGKFGKPAKIVATGAVVVERIDPGDGKKIKAAGRQMVLDLDTNEVIIRGGQPWVISPELNARMADPNGYFKMNMETGDASAVGKTEALVDVRKRQ